MKLGVDLLTDFMYLGQKSRLVRQERNTEGMYIAGINIPVMANIKTTGNDGDGWKSKVQCRIGRSASQLFLIIKKKKKTTQTNTETRGL